MTATAGMAGFQVVSILLLKPCRLRCVALPILLYRSGFDEVLQKLLQTTSLFLTR
jgi:hypothetical protein